MKSKKIIGVLILALAVIAFLGIYLAFKPAGTEGKKSITIEVINDLGDKASYQLNTDAEFLKGAMDDCPDLQYSGEESQYGMMVLEVNNAVADYNKDKSYWAFYVNGDYCQYGIESQVVNDGDVFLIEYTKD